MTNTEDKVVLEQLEWIKKHPPTISQKFPNGEPPTKNAKGSHYSRKEKIVSKRFIQEAEVDEELDLHGLSIDQGVAAVDEFLQMASGFNLHCVRIIHGIGPVAGKSMRKEVRKYIDTKCGHIIETKKIEGHNDGAVIVYLKQKSRHKKTRACR
ncbi:MAG: Smr/MutS family protein [Fibrobacteres bacterium]|nr:Smr/MutS family protein [Fibrobacterota bacterium]